MWYELEIFLKYVKFIKSVTIKLVQIKKYLFLLQTAGKAKLKVSAMTNIQHLARFGVLTDVQYADHEDAPAWYDHSKTRHYRNALNQVHIAFNKWSSEPNSPEYVLQLGDIIDGLNRKSSHAASLDALRLTLELFESNPHIPTFHAVGKAGFLINVC